METKTYVKHVKTGEVFEVEYEGNKFLTTWDDKGEKRVFKRDVLTPYTRTIIRDGKLVVQRRKT